MPGIKSWIIGVALVTGAVGCERRQEEPVPSGKAVQQEANQAGREAANEVRREANLDQAAVDKDAFVALTKARFDVLDKNIDELEDKIENLGDKAPADAKAQVSTLKEKRDVVKKTFDEVKDMPTATWATARGGVDNGIRDLEATYGAIRARIPG